MTRPRKDYITLNTNDGTYSGTACYWNIQPHMFRHRMPGDQMTMKLITASGRFSVGGNSSYVNDAAIVLGWNLNAGNQTSINELTTTANYENPIATVSTSYYTTGAVLYITDIQNTMELDVELMNQITLFACELDLTMGYRGSFTFEVNYYPSN